MECSGTTDVVCIIGMVNFRENFFTFNLGILSSSLTVYCQCELYQLKIFIPKFELGIHPRHKLEYLVMLTHCL